ncbi:MAG: rhodanese-like domain-containing protein [Gammaproteobacteria bacterium]|nr:rhodanese-like domain-containing protein [Gammaproteobacteria bacterium]
MGFIAGCGSEADSSLGTQVTRISAADVAQRIASNTAPIILDVRSAEEYDAGHIPGAVHIPHTELAERFIEIGADRSDEIVVHCQSGRRAGIAEAVLLENGFSNVRDLDGHWKEWSAQGLPIE